MSAFGGRAEVGAGQISAACNGKMAMGFAARPDPTCDLSGKIVEPIQQICPTGKTPKILSIPSDKNILLFRNGKTGLYPSPSHPTKGRCATSTTRGGLRWTRRRFLTKRAKADERNRVVLAPRRWSQVGGCNTPPTTVANKPGRRGEHEISRKPLRGECRVIPV
jgi:hypothetical protein